MKRFLLILFTGTVGLISAQTTVTTTIEPDIKLATGDGPPAIILTRFVSDYPNVRPVWTEQDETFSAEYRVDDTNMGRIVRYDHDGKLVSIENELHNDAYPVAIAKYYIKKYPHEKFVIWSYEDAAGSKKYCARREGGTVWFDRDGKHIPDKYTPAKPAKNKRQASAALDDASEGVFMYFVTQQGF